MYVVWKHLGLPDPTPVQYDIAHFLQHGPKRAIIEAFRGVGKSWITSAFVVWHLLRDPNLKIMVVSASKDRADAFSTFVKRLIHELPMCAHLKARPGQRDSSLSFDVGPARPDHSPSVKSVGITGQLTGSRADIIIPDDVEVVGNSMTQLMRDRLASLVQEFDAILKPLPTSRIVYLGTPQTEMTLYSALEQRGYIMRVWPARYPGPTQAARYGERLAPMILEMLAGDPSLGTACSGRGAPSDPKRFDDLDLVEREASYGRSGFAMQFMLDPSFSDADKFPLKLSDLMVLDCDLKMGPIKAVWASSPELVRNDLPTVGLAGDRLHRPMWLSKENYVPYTGVVMAIDPAGRGSDELGYAIVAMLNGYLFVMRAKGLKGGYSDENLQKLADEAKRYGVNQIIVESNFGDGMFTKLLSPFLLRTHPCAIEEIHSSVQKERRIIDTLEPVMNQHRLIVDSKVISDDFENYNGYSEELKARYQLFYQLTRITREKGALAKDDRLDALAMAVAYWVEVMDRDTQQIEEDHREALRQAEIDRFIELAGGDAQRPSLIAAEFGLMH
ncbi:MAG: phage terminase large subunit [Comamonadaceae bacterium]|nr:phage terminase large subunit [Comamonadaceae bacterium]